MTVLTHAFILKRLDAGDFDRQYVLYTREMGKIYAMAKSAKKITSKLNSSLDKFFLVNLMIAKGKVIDRIAAVQIIDNYGWLAKNYQKAFIANYFLESLEFLIKQPQPDEKIFEIIVSFFQALKNTGSNGEHLVVLNRHLFELLKELGYEPAIKARTQQQLLSNLNHLIMEISEKKIKNYDLVLTIFPQKTDKN